ncbi:MAG TPA: hypothetical protein VMO81_05990 [Aestuariivirgaceae bacterium]|nr:hypothetical protein [Aestuariivirgaceae bacterium]
MRAHESARDWSLYLANHRRVFAPLVRMPHCRREAYPVRGDRTDAPPLQVTLDRTTIGGPRPSHYAPGNLDASGLVGKLLSMALIALCSIRDPLASTPAERP